MNKEISKVLNTNATLTLTYGPRETMGKTDLEYCWPTTTTTHAHNTASTVIILGMDRPCNEKNINMKP